MSDGAPEPPYSIDTSSLMEWQSRYYPLDVFPSVAAKIAALIESGRFLAAALVHEEIQAVGTSGLIDWAKENEAIFVPTRMALR